MSIHIPLELYQLRSNYRSFHTCILIMRKKNNGEKKKKKPRRKKATKDMQLVFKINLKTMLGHSLCMVLYCNVDTQLSEWIPFKNSETGEWMKWGHRTRLHPICEKGPPVQARQAHGGLISSPPPRAPGPRDGATSANPSCLFHCLNKLSQATIEMRESGTMW